MSVIEQIHPLVTRRLRQEVLYPNQPIEHVILKEDDNGLHFGLYDNNKLISVVSLFIEGTEAQFRKFATDRNYQGKGYGSTLLNFILTYTKEQGVLNIWCNARISAIKFYKKHGFAGIGNPFVNNDIEYIRMAKTLDL
ncbi:GNAT family N-acetyltransferase [Olivibacter domesticus]|uniref:Predicted N-acyltransferase, GNAT family n=1 Tax=Olivibacter domesticus TaxID=407022 RepID=A0A1H7YDR5_OLID1|nr:GNAT family N-acetyltransferase [Olivibacter domesticus]SEM43467.1 Predicted N-acyltransferase, GNAT family [Olivibacter domesticus]